jgi:DNA polymerase-3 subunit gamma/tau
VEQPARKSILSGNSIDAILNQHKNIREPVSESQQTQEVEISVDPECERKIMACKAAFIDELHKERPRIAMALEEMKVSSNCISLKVPTEVLYEEIMRNRTEILMLLADVAGIDGGLKLEVSIAEDNKSRKPIKVEDKLRFLTDKNPAITTLRKELNLEIE